MDYIKWLSIYFVKITISTVPNQDSVLIFCYMTNRASETRLFKIETTWTEIETMEKGKEKLHALAAFTVADKKIEELPIV